MELLQSHYNINYVNHMTYVRGEIEKIQNNLNFFFFFFFFLKIEKIKIKDFFFLLKILFSWEL